MATYKSIAIAAEIKDALAKRLSSLTITESFDATSAKNPTIQIGAAATTDDGAFIRVKADWDDNASSVDVVTGQAERRFTPHIIQIAVEANPAGGAGADINPWSVLLPIIAECVLRGTKVEVWEETNGTPPSVTTFNTAAKKKAEFRDLYNPLQNQI